VPDPAPSKPPPPRAAIVGLGLIGGSLGLALRARGWHVSGHDDDPKRVERARAMGAIDEAGIDRDATITFIATPVSVIAVTAREALAGNPKGLVTDVGSVKASVVEAVNDPHFIGGHPMAGSEQEGLEGADAEMFAGKVRDVSEVLAEAELDLAPLAVTVTYHDPCHLVHGQRVRSQPRALLRRIPDLRLIELPDSELCCGSAGIYNVQQPEMAGELARRKVERIRETGARTVVSGNPGCLLQIAQESRRQGFELEVLHPVELLGRALRDDGEGRQG